MSCARVREITEAMIDQWKDMTGEPLSDEMKENFKKALAEGRMKWETVPGFKRDRICPKCGGTEIRVIYHDGSNPDCYRSTGGHEHFVRMCATKYGCGYHWHERCQSDEEYAP